MTVRVSENPIQPRKGNHGVHLVRSGVAKRPVKIAKRRESQGPPVAQSSKEIGPADGRSGGDSTNETNEPPSPKSAKVYPAWQGYWIANDTQWIIAQSTS